MLTNPRAVLLPGVFYVYGIGGKAARIRPFRLPPCQSIS